MHALIGGNFLEFIPTLFGLRRLLEDNTNGNLEKFTNNLSGTLDSTIPQTLCIRYLASVFHHPS